MVLRPRPGRTGEQVLSGLRDVVNAAVNLEGAGGGPIGFHENYVRWSDNAADRLSTLLAPADVERLITTKTYWLMQAHNPHADGSRTALINNEVRQRIADLELEVSSLAEEAARWVGDEHLLVVDTSAWVHSPIEPADIDWWTGIDGFPSAGVHLAVPALVVDELDGLKDRGQGPVRGRARAVLRLLESTMTGRALSGTVSVGRAPTRGPARATFLADPRGHARAPIADDEIISRAADLRDLLDRPVTVMTLDIGMRLRARGQGLSLYNFSDTQAGVPSP